MEKISATAGAFTDLLAKNLPWSATAALVIGQHLMANKCRTYADLPYFARRLVKIFTAGTIAAYACKALKLGGRIEAHAPSVLKGCLFVDGAALIVAGYIWKKSGILHL